MFPSFDSSEDAAWACGPYEGLGVSVSFGDEALDGEFELCDGSEDAAFEALVGEFGEEALDGVEPGSGSWREVESPARVLRELLSDLRVFVGGVIVDNHVDCLSLGDLCVDVVEEANEVLMSMTLHVAADDRSIENVERGEQRGRAIALVIMRHRAGAPRLHRQPRLGPVERLDLALFVDREDDRMSGRIDVEADDVPQLLGEPRIVRQLERTDTMRLKLVGLKDALHRPQADPCRLGQHTAGPVRGFSRRRASDQVNNLLDSRGRQRRLAGLARLVAQQAINALLHEPLLPSPYHRLGFARPAHDFGGAAAIGRGKDNLGAPHMFLRRAAIPDDSLKSMAISSDDVHDNSGSHAESLNRFVRVGNRPNESDH